MIFHAHTSPTLVAGLLITIIVNLVKYTQCQTSNVSDQNANTLASLDGQQPSETWDSNRNVPLNILLEPDVHWLGRNFVPTSVKLNATAEIMDHHYKDFNFTYKWSTRNTVINEGVNLTKISFSYGQPSEQERLNLTVSFGDKYHGFKNKDVVARDPIAIKERDLKLFVEHGELVTADFKLNGTPPIHFCYRFCPSPEMVCEDCYINRYDGRTTTGGELKIAHYLHANGNYTLILKLDNIATTMVKKYSVRVTDTIRPKKIPYVPIISSISAVLIILIALALHVRLRETNYTETADFDFIRNSYDEEEWYEEQSFWQRVKYLLFKADSSENRGLLSSDLNRSRLM